VTSWPSFARRSLASLASGTMRRLKLGSKHACSFTYVETNFVTSVCERWDLAGRPMKEASSSEMGRSFRKALFARRASHVAFCSGVISAGSILRRRLESRASRFRARVASVTWSRRARTRVDTSPDRDFSSA